MKITQSLLDDLTLRAKASPRLRQHMDLRTTPEDGSQRMLNAIEPGSEIPVHRHQHSSETVTVLRGRIMQYAYDGDGRVVDSFEVGPGTEVVAFNVPAMVWHRAQSLESGTVILEAKDGAWAPLDEADLLVPASK